MKKGFTLAEVLITLGIIGIIAALTLPGLRTGMQTRKERTWHTKTCQVLDSAIKLAMYANDKENASDVSAANILTKLQYTTRDSKNYLKDGTEVDLTHYAVTDTNTISYIYVSLPDRSGLSTLTRYYKVTDSLEGLDCSLDDPGLTAAPTS